MKSPSGGKTDEDEPLAFRGGVSVFPVHVGGAGRGDQTDGPRPSQLRRLYIRLFFGGTVWNRLADVPGTQVGNLGPDQRNTGQNASAAGVRGRPAACPIPRTLFRVPTRGSVRQYRQVRPRPIAARDPLSGGGTQRFRFISRGGFGSAAHALLPVRRHQPGERLPRRVI